MKKRVIGWWKRLISQIRQKDVPVDQKAQKVAQPERKLV
jgi:hypothetical protein